MTSPHTNSPDANKPQVSGHPSHHPAPPRNIGYSTGLIYCRTCGTLLGSDTGPSTSRRATNPCQPVPIRPRTLSLTH